MLQDQDTYCFFWGFNPDPLAYKSSILSVRLNAARARRNAVYLTLPHLNSSTGKSSKKLIATEVALQLLEVLTIKYYGMEGGWVSGYHLKRTIS